MEPISDHDLDWLAFCYITGELSAMDSDAFEARLAHDQAAREAVAAAVELSAAVQRRRSVRLLPWMAAAACLAMAVGISSLVRTKLQTPPFAEPVLAAEPGPSRDVALAWSGLRRDDPAHPSELSPWLAESSSLSDAELPTEAEDGESSPPSWLLVAAALRDPAATAPDATKEN